MDDKQLVNTKLASQTLNVTNSLPDKKLITYKELLDMMPDQSIIPYDLVVTLGGDLNIIFVSHRDSSSPAGYCTVSSNGYNRTVDLQTQGGGIVSLRYDEFDHYRFNISCEAGLHNSSISIFTDKGDSSAEYQFIDGYNGNSVWIELNYYHSHIIGIVELYS